MMSRRARIAALALFRLMAAGVMATGLMAAGQVVLAGPASAAPGHGPSCDGVYYRAPYWYCPTGHDPKVARYVDSGPAVYGIVDFHEIQNASSAGPASGRITVDRTECNAKTVQHWDELRGDLGLTVFSKLKGTLLGFLNEEAHFHYAHTFVRGREIRTCQSTTKSGECVFKPNVAGYVLAFFKEVPMTVTFEQEYERQDVHFNDFGDFYWYGTGTKRWFWRNSVQVVTVRNTGVACVRASDYPRMAVGRTYTRPFSQG